MRKLLFFLLTVCSLGATEKTLTDVNERTISAKLIWKTEESVLIVLPNGSEYNVPLKILSEEDQVFISDWIPPEPDMPANAVEGVVVVQTKSGDGVGTGFFVFEAGKCYVYTNQHVIADIQNLEMVDTAGEVVPLGDLEVANALDIARFRVPTRPAFRITDEASNGATVTLLGNSEGAGVITSSEGKIQGIGPEEIEVESDFVPGNSGGPVLDENNRVVAIATYIRRGEEDPDWVEENTRYAETRRFTVRPSRVKEWKTISREDYVKQTRALAEARRKFQQCLWAYYMLTEGTGYHTTLPEDWEGKILEILKNHNSRQERRSTFSTHHASRRTNLRALYRYMDDELGELQTLRSDLTIDYLLKGLFGAENLLKDINALRAEISKEVGADSL